MKHRPVRNNAPPLDSRPANDPPGRDMRRSGILRRMRDRATGSSNIRMLLRILPLTMACYMAIVVVQEYLQYSQARTDLAEKLERVSASQSIILSDAIGHADAVAVGLLVATIVADPDVSGIQVKAADGSVIDAFGGGFDAPGHLVRRHVINQVTGQGFTGVGELTLAMSEDRIRAASRRSLLDHALIAVILLVIVIVGIQFAHRNVVAQPLRRLLSSIRTTEQEGVHRPVDVTSRDEIGRVIEAYNAMRLKQDRVDSELRAARDDAEASSRAKSRFLANMSHELRTPLNSIIGYSEGMREGLFGPLENPTHRDYLDHIHTSGVLLHRLISDILDISRVEAGAVEVDTRDVDVYLLFGQCRKFVAAQIARAGITLTVDAGPDLPVIRSDPDHLLQIMLNLLSNAVKFTGTGGTITLTARRAATSGIALSVADTGMGIAPEQQAKVLEPFYQVAPSLTRNHEGTGLGLAITRSLVALNGGDLALQSSPGIGTTVTVTLPTADRRVQIQSAAAAGQAGPSDDAALRGGPIASAQAAEPHGQDWLESA